jgi:hypothetical protein
MSRRGREGKATAAACIVGMLAAYFIGMAQALAMTPFLDR